MLANEKVTEDVHGAIFFFGVHATQNDDILQ